MKKGPVSPPPLMPSPMEQQQQALYNPLGMYHGGPPPPHQQQPPMDAVYQYGPPTGMAPPGYQNYGNVGPMYGDYGPQQPPMAFNAYGAPVPVVMQQQQQQQPPPMSQGTDFPECY